MSHPPSSDVRLDRAFCAVVAVVTVSLCAWATHQIVTRCGELAMPLDDSYIHFQYARALAELRPFEYARNDPPTPGATSLLWPALLAPAWAAGARGLALAWPATLLGFASFGALAWETRRLAEGLVSPHLARAAGLLVLCFAPFTWFASSGMEVMPFAWFVTRTARILAEYVERAGGTTMRHVLLHAALCVLARPEGVLAGVGAAVAIPLIEKGRRRLAAVGALATCALPNVVYWACTGSAVASTATAKWLPLNPYAQPTLLQDVSYNSTLFFDTLLDGKEWSWIFLPDGGKFAAWAALAALGWCVARRNQARAAIVAALALGALIPTTYETFLVNRLRYLWPFAAAWLVGLVVLVDIVVDAAASALRRKVPAIVDVAARWLAVGAFAFAFAGKLPRSVQDLAESADAIYDQQVSMARWIRRHLPEDARVGVNDTGAIAYIGERRTFDVVGLTTAGEARYWTAGAGSRFEHYERLGPSHLPGYFVVYPEWFAIPQLLGTRLAKRYVDATILGGREKVAYVAEYDALSSGALPVTFLGVPVDELDVADLVSEAEHDYVLGQTTKDDNRVFSHGAIVDAGRARRSRERFALRFVPGGALVLRVVSDGAPRLDVSVARQPVSHAVSDGWQEIRLDVLPELDTIAAVDVAAPAGTFALLHAWSLGPDAKP